MNQRRSVLFPAFLGCTAGIAFGAVLAAPHSDRVFGDEHGPSARAWNPQAAAQYLDSRQVWWQGWDHAQRDHGTRCVSCHTQAPYALARPLLHSASGETSVPPAEKAMLADIEKRVRAWDTMLPFYSDEKYGHGKEVESRNAESVLNATILALFDAQAGHQSDLTRLAFDHAWALQSSSGPDPGAWVWQNFDYAPWESKESQYHWAALMAVAVGMEPAAGSQPYAADPRVAPHLKSLLDYLRTHFAGQPVLNQIVALWADQYFPGILTPSQQHDLLARIDRLQHSDGGWSVSELGPWHRRDDTPLDQRSDGYATGLIVLVREQGPPATSKASAIARGLAWLEANQDQESGSWPAWSLNKNRNPQSDAGLFMTDAATGYAVRALLVAGR